MQKIALFLFVACCLWMGGWSCASETSGNSSTPETVAEPPQPTGGEFQITFGNPSEGWTKNFTANLKGATGPKSNSLLDWMQHFHQANPTEFPMETKEVTGIGVFVESMFGKKNGEEGGKYWMYCVNDTSSPVGAGERIMREGDQVNWYYTLPKELPCKKVGE